MTTSKRYSPDCLGKALRPISSTITRSGLRLGGPEFVRAMCEKVSGNAREQSALKQLAPRPLLQEVIREVERLKGQPWEEFRDRYRDSGRDLVLWFGRKRCGLTLRALAQRVGGLDDTSVGLVVKCFEQRLLVNKKLRHLTDQVDKALRL